MTLSWTVSYMPRVISLSYSAGGGACGFYRVHTVDRVTGSEVRSVEDISLTPGTGKVVVDSLTIDDSSITATDNQVPLILASPAPMSPHEPGP